MLNLCKIQTRRVLTRRVCPKRDPLRWALVSKGQQPDCAHAPRARTLAG